VGGVLALCVPPAVNETKAFFIVAPVIWAALLFPRMRRRPVAGALLVVVIVAASLGVFQSYTSSFGGALSTREAWVRQWEQQSSTDPEESGVMRRVPSVLFTADLLSGSFRTTALGFGPGALTRSDALGYSGPLMRRYGLLLRNPVTLVKFGMELGAVGLVCIAGVLIWAYQTGRRVERNDGDPLWRGVATGLLGSVLTVVVMSVYTATLNADAPACLLWTLAGVTVWRAELLQAHQVEVTR
jgi:hypothetical protein